MALWDSLESSGNVEDRRGMNAGGLALTGVGGLVMFVAMMFLSSQGVDTSVLEQIVGSSQVAQTQTSEQPAEFAGEDSYETFAKKVLGSTTKTWSSIFEAQGKQYAEPKLVLFRDYTPSACGGAMGAVGPHYCPNDQTIYLDETFFAELKNQLGGSTDDVAQAYVISHEVAHAVQAQQGTLEQLDPNDNASSVALELQADCYAGIWMYSLSRTAILEDGEINEAISAAKAVGDDNVQQQTQGRVTPENWTHGSSKQRVDWFNRGYKAGQVSQCNTFN